MIIDLLLNQKVNPLWSTYAEKENTIILFGKSFQFHLYTNFILLEVWILSTHKLSVYILKLF